MVVPRFAGISTFMRLPHLAPTQAPGEIDIALIGIPFDGATTNRPGTRLGPRQVREASSLMRLVNYGTLVAPYDLCACADVGDVPVNPIDVQDTLRRIEAEIVLSAPGRRDAALHRRRPHHLLSDPAGARRQAARSA